jgi:hypothetical protein
MGFAGELNEPGEKNQLLFAPVRWLPGARRRSATKKSGGRDSSRAPRSLAQHSRQKSRPPFVWSKQPPQICAHLLITLDE